MRSSIFAIFFFCLCPFTVWASWHQFGYLSGGYGFAFDDYGSTSDASSPSRFASYANMISAGYAAFPIQYDQQALKRLGFQITGSYGANAINKTALQNLMVQQNISGTLTISGPYYWWNSHAGPVLTFGFGRFEIDLSLLFGVTYLKIPAASFNYTITTGTSASTLRGDSPASNWNPGFSLMASLITRYPFTEDTGLSAGIEYFRASIKPSYSDAPTATITQLGSTQPADITVNTSPIGVANFNLKIGIYKIFSF